VTRGQIVVDRVSRRFVVRAAGQRTIKDLFVARGRVAGSEIWALRDVSLRADAGEALALVGRNGSGKTTLLRLVSGIIKPTSGRIAVDGRVAQRGALGRARGAGGGRVL
jgi:ABC-2 type transport system ATP-binding protein